MTEALGRREAEVEGRLDVRFRSFEMFEGPRRGTDGNRRRFGSSDVGADLSVVFCRSLEGSQRVWGFCHRQQRRMGWK